jgi:excisionase family DNA binding protein
MSEGKNLSVREAARISRRSEETVRRWIWSGKLPARKLGNQYFIDPAELQAALGEGGGVLREPAATYSPAPVREGIEMSRREEARKWLTEVLALGDRVAAEGGRVDVVELIDETREELS